MDSGSSGGFCRKSEKDGPVLRRSVNADDARAVEGASFTAVAKLLFCGTIALASWRHVDARRLVTGRSADISD